MEPEPGWTLNNDPLSIAQRARAHQLLARAYRDTSSLDHEIFHLIDTLDDLRQQKLAHNARIQRLLGAISPLRSFSDDLLLEIFKWCGPGKVTFPPDSSQFPWNVSHVCSRWRRTVWSGPGIREGVEIRVHRPLDIDNTMSVIRSLLPHGNVAFPLRVKSSDSDFAVDFLYEFWGRISHLVVGHLEDSSFGSLVGLPQGVFGSLERLELHFRFTLTNSTYPTSSFRAAAQLRDVSYLGDFPTNSVPERAFLKVLPCQQLTRLRISMISLSLYSIYQILRKCSALISCTLEFVDVNGLTSGPTPELILPHLKSLEVQVTAGSLEPILQSLVLPSLVTLIVSSFSCDDFSQGPPSSLITRSQCELQRLIVDSRVVVPGLEYQEIDAQSLFQLLPFVVDLELPCSIGSAGFRRMRENLLLQRLESFRFHLQPKVIKDFFRWMNWHVEQRRLGNSRLAYVGVWCSDDNFVSENQRRFYGAAGIELEVLPEVRHRDEEEESLSEFGFEEFEEGSE